MGLPPAPSQKLGKGVAANALGMVWLVRMADIFFCQCATVQLLVCTCMFYKGTSALQHMDTYLENTCTLARPGRPREC